VILSLLLCSCNDDSNKVLAQDNIWENVDHLKVDIDGVIDFTADGTYFYFLTDKEIIKVDGYGKKISSEKHENVTGICWDDEAKGLHKILKNCVIITAKGDSIRIDSIKLGEKDVYHPLYKNAATMHLAYDGVKYYSCLYCLGLPNLGFHNPDDQVIEITLGYAGFYDYFKGAPGGLYINSNNLLFLIRTSYVFDNNNEQIKGKIITYNHFVSYDFIEGNNLKIESPVGLYIDKNNLYYSYSKYLKEINKFKGE